MLSRKDSSKYGLSGRRTSGICPEVLLPESPFVDKFYSLGGI
jgi:hypothetical protein